MTDAENMLWLKLELLMIHKISPFPSLLKRGKKAEMVHSITRRAVIHYSGRIVFDTKV